MPSMIQKQLEQFGLDEKEAKLYLTLLDLGPSTVTELTKKAGVTRTLGYHIIDRLGVLGLVAKVSGEGSKKQFRAEHPRAVLQMVKNKHRQWGRRLEEAEEMLPELTSFYKNQDKPTIRYQEGVRGVISLFEESLHAQGEILSVTDVESWKKPEFWEWAKEYNKERNTRKIKERILLLDTPESREWIKTYKPSHYTVYRWIEKEKAKDLLEFGGELNIYDNKVVVALTQNPKQLAVIIESTVFFNILTSLFNIVWEMATPVEYQIS